MITDKAINISLKIFPKSFYRQIKYQYNKKYISNVKAMRNLAFCCLSQGIFILSVF